MDSDSEYSPPVEVTCDGRKLQIRLEQLTVHNLAKIFHIVPDTLFLVSEDGSVALPDGNAQFPDVESFRVWQVEGTKSSKGAGPGFGKPLQGASSSSQATGSGSSGIRGKWKPRAFPRSASAALTHLTGQETIASRQSLQWQKSIEICTLKKGQVVQTSEHPLNLSESTANIPDVASRLSLEAFDGSLIKILNSKNLPLPDVEGTRGAKFWKTAKVVRAIREDEYRDIELSRGPQQKRPHSSSIRISSDSESDGSFTPLVRRRKHRASMVHMSGDLPPQQSMLQSLSEKVSEQTALIEQMSNDLSSNLNRRRISGSSVTSLRQILSCIICKEIAIGKEPVVPTCCSGVVGCKACFEEWLANAQTCPYCRAVMHTVESGASPLPELRFVKELVKAAAID